MVGGQKWRIVTAAYNSVMCFIQSKVTQMFLPVPVVQEWAQYECAPRHFDVTSPDLASSRRWSNVSTVPTYCCLVMTM